MAKNLDDKFVYWFVDALTFDFTSGDQTGICPNGLLVPE